MKCLRESLFDDDLVEKDLIDFSEFKRICKRPETRADMFKIIMTLMTDPDDYVPSWYTETYHEHEQVMDYIMDSLRSQFKKDGEMWFNITENDFEKVGDEMTEEEIDRVNNLLRTFFYRTVVQ